MSGGISLHAVDVAAGVPAQGMAVEVFALTGGRRLLAQGRLGAGGALDHPVARGEGVAAGEYEAHFCIGDWLRAQGRLAGPAFLEVAVFRLTVLDPAEHYHLPLKFTAWGYALFRGS
ncbi:MAG: hydroxyisourate hydrolase [Betaproteobacteria bacterium]